MNAQSPFSTEPTSASDLRNLIISHLNLPPDTVARIYESMLPTEIDFTDTALRLGLVTHEAIAEALVQAHHDLQQPPGVIENAIRKMSSDTRVVIRHGDSVKPGEQLILAHDPYNPRSERIRALRTELLLLNESSRKANIVPVLSPNAQEGRSQLAAELAISFAQLGRRTLLVDADMRKPQQHVLFGSVNEDGLTKALSLGAKPVFHPVIGSPLMHFLNSGPLPPNPLELLSDGRFEKLLSEWRSSYEFIVLDTPPVSLYSDGLAIATMAARVLLVSRSKHTSFNTTRDMLRRLEKTQSQILGAVLNHF